MFDRLGKTLEKRQGGWLPPPPLVRPRVNFPPSFSPQVFFCFLSSERRDIHRTTSPTSFRHCQKDSHYGTFTVFAFIVIVKEALLDEFRMMTEMGFIHLIPGADLGGGCRGCAPPPPEMTCGFLIQLVFCKKNYVVYWSVLK